MNELAPHFVQGAADALSFLLVHCTLYFSLFQFQLYLLLFGLGACKVLLECLVYFLEFLRFLLLGSQEVFDLLVSCV